MQDISLRWLDGRFAFCRLDSSSDKAAPREFDSQEFLAIIRTPTEMAMVCAEDQAPDGAVVEPGWVGLRVVGTLEFEMVGIISRLATTLANAAIPIFVMSTFDTDYVFVQQSNAAAADQALRRVEHVQIVNDPPHGD